MICFICTAPADVVLPLGSKRARFPLCVRCARHHSGPEPTGDA